jgi:hypothetical protein
MLGQIIVAIAIMGIASYISAHLLYTGIHFLTGDVAAQEAIKSRVGRGGPKALFRVLMGEVNGSDSVEVDAEIARGITAERQVRLKDLLRVGRRSGDSAPRTRRVFLRQGRISRETISSLF